MIDLLIRYFKNRNLLLLTAFLFGLSWGEPARPLRGLILPALVMIMTLSTTHITLRELRQMKDYLKDILLVTLIHYPFLSGLILLANHLWISDPDLQVGYVVMAAVPSAVAVIPFTYLLKGEMIVSLLGSTWIYLFALLAAPMISFLFLDVAAIDPSRIVLTLLQLILLPFLLSRLLLRWRGFPTFKPKMGPLINFGFSLILYIVIGMNREVFFGPFDLLLLIFAIAFLRTFVSGHLIDLWSRWLKVDPRRRISYVLFGSYKNLGLAAALSLLIFNERAAVPSALTIPFEFLFLMWFAYFQRRWG
ncbi:MAG: bile acid:sodium symporter [Desulfobacterota bacterium]|nr:bile acid:sodium symporter [Thermodesulfobacteriota bacterium]